MSSCTTNSQYCTMMSFAQVPVGSELRHGNARVQRGVRLEAGALRGRHEAARHARFLSPIWHSSPRRGGANNSRQNRRGFQNAGRSHGGVTCRRLNSDRVKNARRDKRATIKINLNNLIVSYGPTRCFSIHNFHSTLRYMDDKLMRVKKLFDSISFDK